MHELMFKVAINMDLKKLEAIEKHEFTDKNLKSCRVSLRQAVDDARFLIQQLKEVINFNNKYKKTINHIKTCDSMDCVKAWAENIT